MKAFTRVILIFGGLSVAAGIALLTIGCRKYHTSYNNYENDYKFEENYENVKSMEVDVAYGNVTMKEGDSFHIEAYNMMEGKFISTLDNGVWKIQSNTGLPVEISGKLEIFGIDIPYNPWTLLDNDRVPNIAITIPADFTSENININMDAGCIYADSISTREAEIDVNAGYLHVKNLVAGNKSHLSVGTGELIIDNIYAKDISLENDVGVIQATGSLLGDSYAKNGVGSIRLNLVKEIDDYNYDIDCGIGSVTIEGDRYTNTFIDNDAENNLSMECEAGNITVEHTLGRENDN